MASVSTTPVHTGLGALRYVVPNSFTALSMLLGLASVTRSAAGDYRLAAWMILWGVLLDKLDGTAARALKASSQFGVQFDSFADFVVFGFAPAGLFFFRLRGEVPGPLLYAATGAFVLATCGRLARFNITTPPMGDRVFYGVPTTLVGALLGSAYLTWDKYALDPALLRLAPYALLVCAALMVSTVKLPKLVVRKSMVLNVLQFANVAFVYALGPLRLLPEYLFACALAYVLVGAGYYAVRPPRPDEPSAPAKSGQASGASEPGAPRDVEPEEAGAGA
jgi:CDP-diacylglycerol--serine O-phosphatidyltransferase